MTSEERRAVILLAMAIEILAGHSAHEIGTNAVNRIYELTGTAIKILDQDDS